MEIVSLTCTRLASGTGMLDFEPELEELQPDVFVVNHDGDRLSKRELCNKYNIQYIVLDRTPIAYLPSRSSSSIKNDIRTCSDYFTPNKLPYRLCLAGGWMDQPFVSKLGRGSVVVVNILPSVKFNKRSGLATSTRDIWKKLSNFNIFPEDPEELAKLLFAYENPPGSKYISGTQDHLGLAFPGITLLTYDGDFWPETIDNCRDEDACKWLESVLYLIEIEPRCNSYDPLLQKNLCKNHINSLGQSGNECYNAILEKDIVQLGQALDKTWKCWKQILPLTVPCKVEEKILEYSSMEGVTGVVPSGCGGGYLIVVSSVCIEDSIRVGISY
eukprot:TRINITY_DN2483_c0_g1_i3.p1 TRINITY_DN2483_c0_g1~~TRINITY_DN2483_c0_g1_i3.p1  ORF type:complete len:329 (-),score=56.64 TRINITY_DN2483_c0_g1_i3:23-1009(-)